MFSRGKVSGWWSFFQFIVQIAAIALIVVFLIITKAKIAPAFGESIRDKDYWHNLFRRAVPTTESGELSQTITAAWVYYLLYIGAILFAIGVVPALLQIISTPKTGNTTGGFSGLFAIATFILVLMGYLKQNEMQGVYFIFGITFAICSMLTALVATFWIRIQD